MKDTKISLINLPRNSRYPQPPLGLASLAAVLEKEEFFSEIIDSNALNLSMDDIAEKTRNSDIVGISAMTPSINIAIILAKKIKELNPKAIVILGGPHPTILPEDTLRKSESIDLVIRGEGENTILEVAKSIENKKSFNNILGISYKLGNNIQNNPNRELISDLDSLPFLAYHLLPLKKYKFHPPHGRKRAHMAMLTSRGCPYKCTFCSKSVFGDIPRYQSPNRIVNEIEYLYDNFNVREIDFYDDTFTLRKERVIEFTQELKERNLDIEWTCEARVNLINQVLLNAMQKSGCYLVSFGIESGNQHILNTLNKKITLRQIRNAVEITHHAGIESVGYFMLGSPGETPDTIRNTIDFAKSLPLDYVQFSIATPFPGTAFYDEYIKSHAISENWEDFIYANLDSGKQPVFETELLSKNDLSMLNDQAYKEFYLRLSYFKQRIMSIHSLNDLRNNFGGAKMLINMIRR
ncbi:B12-binding domain-containing radical SAM protein [Methanomicrobium antiquum]|uniref:B12-binding domain-containing radical SAM protein n=1 Tax=Methanomicrobium antiquum TaxID=487686 RepID=A0AAF0FRU2_9EURY|nr:radical SAM protein [Methanomicrobium antiquum]WFN37397.1 B12-binding domain-containing radical SAM protein [Methanomicrobium antiquum]